MQGLQSLPLNNVAVSACLIGKKCRYDGKSSKDIKELKSCVAFCPEILGGLSVPRVPCTIDSGDGEDVLNGKAQVIGKDGLKYTEEFIKGANAALALCRENGIKTVILKEKSPSCGVKFVYNGEELVAGCGVTAALLKKHGIIVLSSEEVIN